MFTWVVEHGMVLLLVPGCRKMFTSVGDPFLLLEFFHQLVFPCRHTCSSETRDTIPTSLLVFVGNIFTPLILNNTVTRTAEHGAKNGL